MSAVHICFSRMDYTARRVRECPTCKRRRRFFVWAQDYYGAVWTCCGCGDAWEDGERMPRSTASGWRKERIAWAKRMWAGGTSNG